MSGLFVKPGLVIPDAELLERFIHASGPGGQNVNKVASAVQLSFDVLNSPGLPQWVKAALAQRLSKEGLLIVTARQHREQERNRAEARIRLAQILRKAATPKTPRRQTRVPKSSKRLRLEAKKRRGARKKDRARPALS